MAKLTSQDRQALARFSRRLRNRLRDQVEDIRLFGSKARGDAAKHSDLDVLVVLGPGQGTLAHREPVYHIASRITGDTEVVLSPKVLSRDQYQNLRAAGEPLLVNIERDGIPL